MTTTNQTTTTTRAPIIKIRVFRQNIIYSHMIVIRRINRCVVVVVICRSLTILTLITLTPVLPTNRTHPPRQTTTTPTRNKPEAKAKPN
jgi:hypothetical protein